MGVVKALCGYRKWPRLRQFRFFKAMQSVKCFAFQFLESEPAMCADVNYKVVVVVHVDYALILGDFGQCAELLEELKKMVLIRETVRIPRQATSWSLSANRLPWCQRATRSRAA